MSFISRRFPAPVASAILTLNKCATIRRWPASAWLPVLTCQTQAPRGLPEGPARMKFFVDTADVAEIRALAEAGLVDGVTTNPSLIAKSGRQMAEVIAEICAITPGPVSAEVTATDFDAMLRRGPLPPRHRQERRGEGAADRGRAAASAAAWRTRARRSTSPSASPRRRRCSRPRPAPPTSPPSSAGWTTSPGRHAADRRHPEDLPQLPASLRQKSWSRPSATRSIWSRRRSSAPRWRPCRPPSSASSSSIR